MTENRSKRLETPNELSRWLVELLEANNGQMWAREVTAIAGEAGVNPSALRRARERAGISTWRTGYGPGKGWTWSLTSRYDLTQANKAAADVAENGTANDADDIDGTDDANDELDDDPEPGRRLFGPPVAEPDELETAEKRMRARGGGGGLEPIRITTRVPSCSRCGQATTTALDNIPVCGDCWEASR